MVEMPSEHFASEVEGAEQRFRQSMIRYLNWLANVCSRAYCSSTTAKAGSGDVQLRAICQPARAAMFSNCESVYLREFSV